MIFPLVFSIAKNQSVYLCFLFYTFKIINVNKKIYEGCPGALISFLLFSFEDTMFFWFTLSSLMSKKWSSAIASDPFIRAFHSKNAQIYV